MYTVRQKNRDTILLSIASPNIDRFSKFQNLLSHVNKNIIHSFLSFIHILEADLSITFTFSDSSLEQLLLAEAGRPALLFSLLATVYF